MSVHESKRVFVSVISADKSSEDGTRSESIPSVSLKATKGAPLYSHSR